MRKTEELFTDLRNIATVVSDPFLDGVVVGKVVKHKYEEQV